MRLRKCLPCLVRELSSPDDIVFVFALLEVRQFGFDVVSESLCPIHATMLARPPVPFDDVHQMLVDWGSVSS